MTFLPNGPTIQGLWKQMLSVLDQFSYIKPTYIKPTSLEESFLF